jgi:predicted RNase H-like nuclease (RuvC/YqgF family)
MAERLADKIERLIAAAERAHQERNNLRKTVDALAEENRELRRLIDHSHTRVEELAGQLRRLEDEAVHSQPED